MWRAQKAIYVGRTWKSVSRVVCEMVVLKRDYYVRENAYSGKATLMRSRYTRSVPGMRSEYTKTSDIHFPKNRGEWNRGMNTSLKGNFWNECKKHCTCHTLTKEFFLSFLYHDPFSLKEIPLKNLLLFLGSSFTSFRIGDFLCETLTKPLIFH